MATDSKVGLDGVIGQLTVTMDEGMRVRLQTNGVMTDPAFMELAIGYVRQYADRAWDKSFKPTNAKENE